MTALEKWRQDHEMSYAALAIRLQESQTSVFNWCKGQALPRQRKWRTITKATGLTSAQILGLAK